MTKEEEVRLFANKGPNLPTLFFLLLLISRVCLSDDGAQSCETIDFSEKLGKARDQGSSDYCHAFVTADLLSEATGRRVSAFSVLVDHLNLDRDTLDRIRRKIVQSVDRPKKGMRYVVGQNLSGLSIEERARGYTPITIGKALESKICLETEVPSEGEFDKNTGKDFISQIFAKVIDESNQATGKEIVSRSDRFDRIAAKLKLYTEQRCHSRLDAPNSLEVRHNIYLAGSREERDKTNIDIENRISESIKRMKPISFDFDSCAVRPCQSGAPGSHVSIVVGQKWDSKAKKCLFKVRDSFGSNCGKLRSTLKCEDGHYWISSQELVASIRGLTWIEQSPASESSGRRKTIGIK